MRLSAFLALVVALVVLFLFLRVAFEPFAQPGPWEAPATSRVTKEGCARDSPQSPSLSRSDGEPAQAPPATGVRRI